MSEEKPKRDFPEIRIRGVSKKTKQTLEWIAANKGVDFPIYMKNVLAWIIETTPAHLKQEPRKD